MSKTIKTLIRAVEDSDESRHQIARGSGIHASQLCRLVKGIFGLNIETAERLADYLGLEIVVRPKAKKRGGK